MGSPITAMAVGPDHILGDQEKQEFDGDVEPNFESWVKSVREYWEYLEHYYNDEHDYFWP